VTVRPRIFTVGIHAPILALACAAATLVPGALDAQATMASAAASTTRQYLYDARDFGIDPAAVTFSKDIAPILQRSCETCHRANGAGPMSLVTYEEVRRYAGRNRDRTAIRDRMGAMPPWYVEKDIGIQHYKNDPSLSDVDLARIQAWVANGAPEGNRADLPAPRVWGDGTAWTIRPDLVVSSQEITVATYARSRSARSTTSRRSGRGTARPWAASTSFTT
jgi:hypothetical protein